MNPHSPYADRGFPTEVYFGETHLHSALCAESATTTGTGSLPGDLPSETVVGSKDPTTTEASEMHWRRFRSVHTHGYMLAPLPRLNDGKPRWM